MIVNQQELTGELTDKWLARLGLTEVVYYKVILQEDDTTWCDLFSAEGECLIKECRLEVVLDQVLENDLTVYQVH